MNIRKNKINNKEYWYIDSKVFINKGKTKVKKKSLGSVEVGKPDLKKINAFITDLIDYEIEERTKYWENKIVDKKFVKYISVQKLESLRSLFFRKKECGVIGSIAETALEKAFLVDFIYNSNRIEGSKIPRNSVEDVIRGNVSNKKNKLNEVINSVKAVNYVDNKFNFNKASLIKLHSILLKHEPTNMGIRKIPIIAGNTECLDWKKIESELKKLFVWYNDYKDKMYPPELAFKFYYKYERIHPFKDGNGRSGRLVMNKILKDNKYHPIIVWNSSKDAQDRAFIKEMDSRMETFYKFMVGQYKKTYNIYIKKIDDAIKLEELTSFFMRPSE